MECRLSSVDGTWSATITLRIEFDSVGNRLAETKSYPFGHIISDPSAVELGLRRAQTAILNWDTSSYKKFIDMTEQALSRPLSGQLKFSKNVVCIAISGPELTDLVFIDLPGTFIYIYFKSQHKLIKCILGLIQNADEETVNLVEETVTDQIAGNSIILMTLPMSGVSVGHACPSDPHRFIR